MRLQAVAGELELRGLAAHAAALAASAWTVTFSRRFRPFGPLVAFCFILLLFSPK
jgi:hypothetical protein